MRLKLMFAKWRQLLLTFGAICTLIAIGFVGWLLWELHASEDKLGESPFKDDKSLVLQRKGPGEVSYKIDNAPATFRLDVVGADRNFDRIFPSYAAALKFATDAGLPSMPSVQMIHGKCKQFDDDLCAALEQAVQTGSAGIPGKSDALKRLAQKLMEAREDAPAQARAAVEQAILYVATAVSLGGGSVPLDPSTAAEVEQRKTVFLRHPLQATPIGFWNENETLRQTFIQDRYLMQGLRLEDDTEACVVLARVISDDPELSRAFGLFRAFDAKLTNRPVYVRAALPARAVSFRDTASALPQGFSLSDLLAPEMLSQTRKKLASDFGSDAGFALCNYATSPEYSLFVEAFRNGALSFRNASLELIIDAIKGGKISLKPKENSGWYDYQWYALETLLLPERAQESVKLMLTDAYKKRLEEAFKSSIAKNRETHIKQLPVFTLCQTMSPDVPPPKLEIHPEFSAEPTTTVYLRSARAYRFLHTALTTVLGDETLRTLRRKSLGNIKGLDLGDELNRMALLCYGLHSVVSAELGLLPSYLPDEISTADLDEAKRIASQWLASVGADPDLARDSRIAVPAIGNPDGTLDYWATGGIRLQRVRYDYKREPRVMDATPIFVPGYYYLPTDVTLEFQRRGILSRNEFRRMCDSCTDEASLRRLLGAPDRTALWNLSRIVGTGVVILLGGLALFIAWKKRVFSRRVVLCAPAVVALLLSGWILRMYFDTGYRIKFVVRHIVSRSPLMAEMYMNRSLFRYSHYGKENAPPAVVRSLVDLLRDSDQQVRYIAISYLSFLRADSLSGVATCEENLRGMAEEIDSQLAVPALSLLGCFRNDRNVEFLRAKLNNSTNDEPTRLAALAGVVQTGDPRGIDDVIACTHLPDGDLRREAIRLLGRYDDQKCLDRIADLLVLGDPKSSLSALAALRDFGYSHPEHDVSGRMDPLLLTAVHDPKSSLGLRCGLAKAIRDEPTRIRAYENMLLFPNSQDAKSAMRCQVEAARGLGAMKSARNTVIPILQKVLQDTNTD